MKKLLPVLSLFFSVGIWLSGCQPQAEPVAPKPPQVNTSSSARFLTAFPAWKPFQDQNKYASIDLGISKTQNSRLGIGVAVYRKVNGQLTILRNKVTIQRILMEYENNAGQVQTAINATDLSENSPVVFNFSSPVAGENANRIRKIQVDVAIKDDGQTYSKTFTYTRN